MPRTAVENNNRMSLLGEAGASPIAMIMSLKTTATALASVGK